ncbi:MAG TPA: phosphatidylserine/phosphatidylglycerophosphate/cardiolipin synthase family protein [Capsulimonadaceae bacterium]|jgi:phosphatidylserine/phosphatidylglycerophosphate/cardiolipin synthase-like enzyme
MPNPSTDSLRVSFLTQGEQSAADVAARYARFVAGARQSLDIAWYDFRLSQPLERTVADALDERSQAGVAVRIVYDADKPEPPPTSAGMDPAPSGTGAHVQALGHPFRRIGGMKLMHNKYTVRDAGTPFAAIWTGSTNFTDDAWTLQDNNIVELSSPLLATYYARDFSDLWETGTMEGAGAFATEADSSLTYAGESLTARVMFSPGRGHEIDTEVARIVSQATRRIRICSMLLNSGTLLNALLDHLDAGSVAVDGVYDKTQMDGVLYQWQSVPSNHWKIPAVRDIAQRAALVGKRSRPYSPGNPHDFMHNKVIVVDDTVITGSYNFSRSAEQNAENVLFLHSTALAETYSRYIDHLKAVYGHATPAR